MNIRLEPIIASALVLVLTIPLALPVEAQDPPEGAESVQGTWAGPHPGEFQYQHVFRIEWDDGAWTGRLEAPAWRWPPLPLTVSIDGDSIMMEGEDANITFEGRLASGEDTIRGTYNGETTELTKVSSPPDIREPPSFEPFRGITTGGEPRRTLFPIRSTGVSTEPVVEAAKTFLGRLGPEKRERATFPVESVEWRHWHNSPFLKRRGVSLRQMSEPQRAAAFDLLRAGLSARGFSLARDIMRVRDYLSHLTENPDLYGEHLYHLTVMGEPSTSEPWGWQIDGHHLIVNFFVLGDQVVMTPSFFGSEPTVADSGRHAGIEVLQEEQNRGLEFLRSLRPSQREAAIVETEKTEGNLRAGPFHDNLTLGYKGVKADELSTSQREELLNLIQVYVGRMREGHAGVRMEEVRKHLDETHFAWIGGMGPESVFYYRIQSPVLLIEFDHIPPGTLEGPNGPTRDHIHTVVRTPNGGDYGKSLLRQHYEAHENNPDHEHHR